MTRKEQLKRKLKQVGPSQPKKKQSKPSGDDEWEELDTMGTVPTGEKPAFTISTPLSTLNPEWQTRLYLEKFKKVRENGHMNNIFVCERTVSLDDFHVLGVVDCFEKLGWMAALTFHDPEQKDRIPTKVILEWMSTLKKDEGDDPPRTTTLTGRVGKKKMILSFDTLSQVANFDTRPEEDYVFPSFETLSLSYSANPISSKAKVGSEEGKMQTALPPHSRNRVTASSETQLASGKFSPRMRVLYY